MKKFCKKLHNFSEIMAKIDMLFTKSLTFLIQILNFPPPLCMIKIHQLKGHPLSISAKDLIILGLVSMDSL